MKNKDIVVILDNIRSRENVGSIFRTSDAAGVSKLYLCGITPRPPHDKISKTALQADTYVLWEYYRQTWRLIDKLKQDGYLVLALEKTKISKAIFGFKPKGGKIALILGNEVLGLSTGILRRASAIVNIPMYGQKESLNVAVAFGIAIYAFNHQ